MSKQFSFKIGDKNLEINLNEKIFEIELKKQDAREIIDSRDFTLIQATQCHDEATAIYTLGCEEKYIRVKINYWLTQDELLSKAEIVHRYDGSIASFKYPCVHKEDVSTFDNLLMSSPWGDNIERPTKTIKDVSTSLLLGLARIILNLNLMR